MRLAGDGKRPAAHHDQLPAGKELTALDLHMANPSFNL